MPLHFAVGIFMGPQNYLSSVNLWKIFKKIFKETLSFLIKYVTEYLRDQ